MTAKASPTAAATQLEAPRWRDRWAGRRVLPFSAWHLVLLPLSFLLLLPLIWMVVTSLESPSEASRFPPTVVPSELHWSNYSNAWHAAPFGRFLLNSLIVAVVVVASNLVFCSLAGYAFARLRFAGRGVLFAVLMATLMIPIQVTMVPLFLITKWLGQHVSPLIGIDSVGALTLPNLATAFGVFLLRQFFMTVPVELEEAARIDGTSRLGVIFKILLPLSAPVLATLAALTFLKSWNDFMWPLIAVNSTRNMTIPLGLTSFQGAHVTDWSLLMAGNVMSLLPMIAVFLLAQRFFVRSVAATGLKG